MKLESQRRLFLSHSFCLPSYKEILTWAWLFWGVPSEVSDFWNGEPVTTRLNSIGRSGSPADRVEICKTSGDHQRDHQQPHVPAKPMRIENLILPSGSMGEDMLRGMLSPHIG